MEQWNTLSSDQQLSHLELQLEELCSRPEYEKPAYKGSSRIVPVSWLALTNAHQHWHGWELDSSFSFESPLTFDSQTTSSTGHSLQNFRFPAIQRN
jgi:hypothetical protein